MQIEITPKGYFHSINQFKFVKDIGVGSFGKVKLATHRGTRKQYAIKIIDLNANLSQTQLHVIARQIKVHSKLDHPHIIKLWDTIFNDNKIYMVMDYAKNGSLFKYHSNLLQEGIQPTTSQIYQFFFQTLQALKYLHLNDIMHRDIKPQNLLLDEDLNVKLCDFGWATNQITTSRSTFCGTYEYMAPEMALQKSYDYKIDIWALGVLLYELVHGRAPFQAQNLKMMKQRINKGSYQINSNCSGNLKDLIVDILQFIPQKRLTISQIESHPWVQICQNVGFNVAINLDDENINLVQGNNRNSSKKNSSNIKPPQNLRKHQHQRSMGNFLQNYKNHKQNQAQHNNTSKQMPILTIIQQNQSHTNTPIMSKQEQIRKHKRNITQPNSQLIEKERSYQKLTLNTKKMQLLKDTLQTETDTPYTLTQTEATKLLAALSRQKKKKQKCKTQADDQFAQFEFQMTSGSKKNLFQFDQSLESKKKKIFMTTEVGPSLPSNHTNNNTFSQHLNHIRNYSSLPFKQNDLSYTDNTQKMRKKTKIQQRANPKVKRIQEKLSQISGKFSIDKSRDRDKIAAL